MGLTLKDLTKMVLMLEDLISLDKEKMVLINKESTEKVLIEMGSINFITKKKMVEIKI